MAHFSNGTQGALYEERVCYKCKHYPEDDINDCCPVWMAHLMNIPCEVYEVGLILDDLIPMKNGKPQQCRMFAPVGDGIPEGFEKMIYKQHTPKVGVGVAIIRGAKVLLGLRKGSHGAGEWSLPGGHVDIGEDPVDTCVREVREETGIKIDPPSPIGWTNDVMIDDGLHYITLFFQTAVPNHVEAELLEEDSAEEWRWFGKSDLPENIFMPTKKKIRSFMW